MFKIPVLRLLKEPAHTITDLYNRYPRGGEHGWFAFITVEKTFFYWDIDTDEWQRIGGSVNNVEYQPRAVSKKADLIKSSTWGSRIPYGEPILVFGDTPENNGTYVLPNGRDYRTMSNWILTSLNPSTGNDIDLSKLYKTLSTNTGNVIASNTAQAVHFKDISMISHFPYLLTPGSYGITFDKPPISDIGDRAFNLRVDYASEEASGHDGEQDYIHTLTSKDGKVYTRLLYNSVNQVLQYTAFKASSGIPIRGSKWFVEVDVEGWAAPTKDIDGSALINGDILLFLSGTIAQWENGQWKTTGIDLSTGGTTNPELTGPRGPQGFEGIQGKPGKKGDQGEQGLRGTKWFFPYGPDGLSYPTEGVQEGDILLVNGELLVRSYGNWNYTEISIKGERGEQGIQGIQGIPGSGSGGTGGYIGEQGIQGIQGPQGKQGVQGPQGPPGKDAETIIDVDEIFRSSNTMQNISNRTFWDANLIAGSYKYRITPGSYGVTFDVAPITGVPDISFNLRVEFASADGSGSDGDQDIIQTLTTSNGRRYTRKRLNVNAQEAIYTPFLADHTTNDFCSVEETQEGGTWTSTNTITKYTKFGQSFIEL